MEKDEEISNLDANYSENQKGKELYDKVLHKEELGKLTDSACESLNESEESSSRYQENMTTSDIVSDEKDSLGCDCDEELSSQSDNESVENNTFNATTENSETQEISESTSANSNIENDKSYEILGKTAEENHSSSQNTSDLNSESFSKDSISDNANNDSEATSELYGGDFSNSLENDAPKLNQDSLSSEDNAILENDNNIEIIVASQKEKTNDIWKKPEDTNKVTSSEIEIKPEEKVITPKEELFAEEKSESQKKAAGVSVSQELEEPSKQSTSEPRRNVENHYVEDGKNHVTLQPTEEVKESPRSTSESLESPLLSSPDSLEEKTSLIEEESQFINEISEKSNGKSLTTEGQEIEISAGMLFFIHDLHIYTLPK